MTPKTQAERLDLRFRMHRLLLIVNIRLSDECLGRSKTAFVFCPRQHATLRKGSSIRRPSFAPSRGEDGPEARPARTHRIDPRHRIASASAVSLPWLCPCRLSAPRPMPFQVRRRSGTEPGRDLQCDFRIGLHRGPSHAASVAGPSLLPVMRCFSPWSRARISAIRSGGGPRAKSPRCQTTSPVRPPRSRPRSAPRHARRGPGRAGGRSAAPGDRRNVYRR